MNQESKLIKSRLGPFMEGRVADMLDGPYFTGKRHDVGGGTNELQRGRSVQSILDYGERTVIIDLHQ